MTSIVDEITLKARSLPAEDRARLAEDLLSSLQEVHDLAIEAAWDTEIRRRLDEVEAQVGLLDRSVQTYRAPTSPERWSDCSGFGTEAWLSRDRSPRSV